MVGELYNQRLEYSNNLEPLEILVRILFHPQGFYQLGLKANQYAEFRRIASTFQNGMTTVLDSLKYPIYGVFAWDIIRNLL